jgi:hypothetical protein
MDLFKGRYIILPEISEEIHKELSQYGWTYWYQCETIVTLKLERM